MTAVDTTSQTLPRTFAKMQAFIDAGLVPGAAVAWRDRGGAIQYRSAGTLGFGKEAQVDERSIFRIYATIPLLRKSRFSTRSK